MAFRDLAWRFLEERRLNLRPGVAIAYYYYYYYDYYYYYYCPRGSRPVRSGSSRLVEEPKPEGLRAHWASRQAETTTRACL